MKPIEVFALDDDMNRLTGSIPYTSLMWERKYYGPGRFQMTVLSSIYSTDWAYIYCADRPETGMVQKVEYSDATVGPNGEDTVVVSGFFLEEMLNNLVFLIEQTEQEAYYTPKPMRTISKAPSIVQGDNGKYYLAETSADGTTHYKDMETGLVDRDDVNMTPVDVQPSSDMQQEKYPTNNTDRHPDGYYYKGYYKTGFDYYAEDGKLHQVKYNGDEATYDLVANPTYTSDGSGKNFALYKDDDGTIRWVNGVARSYNSTYYRRVNSWEESTEGLEIVNLPGDNQAAVAYREVKGPWQLRTDVGQVGQEMDNVQQVILWAQTCFGNNMQYDEPGFTGETKVIDPSLQRVGDLFFNEMKTVGASIRVLYDFILNQMIFSIWRGLNRTQSQGIMPGDEPVEPEEPDEPLPEPILPDGYTELEYIESTGIQYIDTDFTPGINSRVTADFEITQAIDVTHRVLFGSRFSYEARQYYFGWAGNNSPQRWRSDYGANQSYFNGIASIGRHAVDKNKGVTTLDGVQVSVTNVKFVTPGNMYVFCGNNNGSASGHISARLYSMVVYDNGTAVRNFIPARRDSDEQAGLYDLISDVFYSNQGSGTFGEGPEVDYPEPEPPIVVTNNPWAVFSDTWGTLYGFTASRDSSNYRNKCYVLYDYWVPDSWDDNGHPAPVAHTRYNEQGQAETYYTYPQTEKRGYETVRLEDESDDKEVWLDLREEGPEGSDDLPDPTAEYSADSLPDVSGINKVAFDAWQENCKSRGRQLLINDYPVIENLDTGTLSQDGYMVDWDLGDKVDMAVDTIGMKKESRIVGVTEVHESGSSTVQLEMGDELLTTSKKSTLV